MKRLIPLVLITLSVPVFAGETWKNVSLVDTMCSAKVKADPDKHTRDCAIGCEKGGFGIITADGKFLKFDDAGNAKAVAALKASSKKDHLRADVSGDLAGDTIKVTALTLTE
jgi:hypothetical protein